MNGFSKATMTYLLIGLIIGAGIGYLATSQLTSAQITNLQNQLDQLQGQQLRARQRSAQLEDYYNKAIYIVDQWLIYRGENYEMGNSIACPCGQNCLSLAYQQVYR